LIFIANKTGVANFIRDLSGDFNHPPNKNTSPAVGKMAGLFCFIAFQMIFYIFDLMSKTEKILMLLLSGQSDANIEFSDLLNLLERLGFIVRIKGSHHIFFRNDIEEIINLQPDKNKAKPYQVKQVRNLILKYNLKIGSNE
jgi:predicted RNA binding protein YcfA (HicA-like mRNA interferase family)